MYRRLRRRTGPPAASGAADEPISDVGHDDPGLPDEHATTDALTATVAAHTSELSRLRSRVVEFGRRHGADDDLADDLELLVSELATNVVRHTDETEISLSISVATDDDDHQGSPRADTDRRRRWTVLMSGARSAPASEDPTLPAVDQVDGRGLVIVHAIADQVDVGGNMVRCTLLR